MKTRKERKKEGNQAKRQPSQYRVQPNQPEESCVRAMSRILAGYAQTLQVTYEIMQLCKIQKMVGYTNVTEQFTLLF